MRRTSSILALSACAAMATSVAQAQPPTRQSGAASWSPEQMQARWSALRESHARRHAEDLRIVLRLRPNQEPALQELLQAERPAGPPMGRAATKAPGEPPATTPQRLDEMARRGAEREQIRERHLAAVKAFYAALDPEQQRAFDALQRLQHGGHGDGRPGPRGPMGRRG